MWISPRLLLSGLALTLLAACAQGEPQLAPLQTEAVPVIFDTDLGYDADDAAALAVLHRLADQGEAEILATMSVVGDPLSAAALDVINTYYGRPDTPIGAMKGTRWSEAQPYWFETNTDFLGPLVREFRSDVKHKDEVPGAVALYRQVLAAQPDRSVTVVAVGFSLNLFNLLASPADAYSPLDGRALVARKVAQLVYMGGRLDASRPDFNLGDGPYRDGTTSQRVLERWPTEIVFSGAEVGDHIRTGRSLRDQLPDNPVARAYELYPGVNAHGTRPSWDLTAVLYAVRGGGDFWRVVEGRELVIADDGTTRWRPGETAPPRRYLEPVGSEGEIEAALEALLAPRTALAGLPGVPIQLLSR